MECSRGEENTLLTETPSVGGEQHRYFLEQNIVNQANDIDHYNDKKKERQNIVPEIVSYPLDFQHFSDNFDCILKRISERICKNI